MGVDDSNFVENCVRTEAPITDAVIERISNLRTIRLLHAAMGMATEVGEFIDQLKGHVFYGKPLDLVNLAEELGDNEWYVGIACDAIDLELAVVLNLVINKLKKRYPDKFTERHAVNRNLEAERAELEHSSAATRSSDPIAYSTLDTIAPAAEPPVVIKVPVDPGVTVYCKTDTHSPVRYLIAISWGFNVVHFDLEQPEKGWYTPDTPTWPENVREVKVAITRKQLQVATDVIPGVEFVFAKKES